MLCYGESQAIKVAFLNPDTKGNPFWNLVTSFMQASANDLGMDLTVVYSQRGDRFEHLKLAESIINHKDKPDYFISIIKVGSSDKVMAIVEKNKVNYFSINTHVLAEGYSLIKTPREMSRYWIGQMIPNDVQAGQRLASMLIEEARSKNLIDKQIHIIGVGGARDSSATFDRVSGLKKSLLNEANAVLYQVVNTDWSQKHAKLKVSGLLKRYKDVNLIWCASDTIGLGAIDALNELGMPAGKKVLSRWDRLVKRWLKRHYLTNLNHKPWRAFYGGRTSLSIALRPLPPKGLCRGIRCYYQNQFSPHYL